MSDNLYFANPREGTQGEGRTYPLLFTCRSQLAASVVAGVGGWVGQEGEVKSSKTTSSGAPRPQLEGSGAAWE